MCARTPNTMACVSVLLTMLGCVDAAAQGDVELTYRVEKIEAFVSDGGDQEARLVAAEQVFEGDELRYTITFTNLADETVAPNSIVVTNPIPESTEYIEGSAFGSGAEVEFSVDGGQSFAPSAGLTMRDAEGERNALPGDYTTIRWHYGPPLQSGQQSHVFFRVRML